MGLPRLVLLVWPAGGALRRRRTSAGGATHLLTSAVPPHSPCTRTLSYPPCAAAASSPGMPDVERLARKLEAKRISLAELCQLYRASSALPRLEDALRCHEGAAAGLLVER